MNDIFLTSDSHFFHAKSFIYEARGFQSIEEMNEGIVENWNKVVKPNDIIYHLGDVMLGQDLQAGINLVARLNGIKYLAYGNHDSDARIKAFIDNNLFEDIQMGYRIKPSSKKSFILSHYPQLVANAGMEKPVYTIHGHTHSNDKWSDVYHAYNVNMDAHNCTPVNIEDILADIRSYSW